VPGQLPTSTEETRERPEAFRCPSCGKINFDHYFNYDVRVVHRIKYSIQAQHPQSHLVIAIVPCSPLARTGVELLLSTTARVVASRSSLGDSRGITDDGMVRRLPLADAVWAKGNVWIAAAFCPIVQGAARL
jgi:hypothetical protein